MKARTNYVISIHNGTCSNDRLRMLPNANQACNVNSCTYDQANCIQAECAANGGQDLNCLLNGLGACLQDGCQNGNVRPAGVSGLGSCRR